MILASHLSSTYQVSLTQCFRPEDIAELLISLIEDDSKNGAAIKIHKVYGKVRREEVTFRQQSSK